MNETKQFSWRIFLRLDFNRNELLINRHFQPFSGFRRPVIHPHTLFYARRLSQTEVPLLTFYM